MTIKNHTRIFFYMDVILVLFLIQVSQIIPTSLLQCQTASATNKTIMNGTKTTNSEILGLSKIQLLNYIQNLHGDTVDTWIPWNIVEGRIIHIHLTNAANVPQSMIDAMNSAILSTKNVTIDDSISGMGPKGTSHTYYVGWVGAVENAYSKSKYHIPQKFDISGSSSGMADIEIILTNDVHPEGYSGYTKSLVDRNHIIKSMITIYNVSSLDVDKLAAITRHEFGHALGLGHSTIQEDLMNTMLPDYPYISSCDIDALTKLYGGETNSKVICKQ